MPVRTVGDQRWAHVGNAPGGDRIFRRHGSGAGYEDMTKDDLSAELERRDLPKTGNKDELVARLNESDAGR